MHYTVAVIIPNEKIKSENDINALVEDALYKFSQHIKVEPYVAMTKEESINKYYKYVSDFTKNHYKNKLIESNDLFSFSEYYKEFKLDRYGNLLSTHNPNGKYDWYNIGGRWDNSILLKDNTRSNFAQIKDIQFKINFSYVEINDIKNEYNDLIEKYKFFKYIYPIFESYLFEKKYFTTYSILNSKGEWIEPEKGVGWLKIVHSDEKINEFINYYMDYINQENENNWLVVVDCHI